MMIRYSMVMLTTNPTGLNMKVVPIASTTVITNIKQPLIKTRRISRCIAAVFATLAALVPPFCALSVDR